MQTYNDFQWQLNKWYEIKNPDENEDLCTDKWFHFYYHPLLAVLFNPIHANIDKPRLFQLEVGGLQKNDNGLKGGCTKMRLVKEVELPEITIKQRVKFAILCALEVCNNDDFTKWAKNWLSGKNRTAAAAYAAADATSDAYAAYAAAHAAYAAAHAADAANIVKAANVAKAAAYAAAYAAYAKSDLDLILLAKKAVK